MGKTILSDYDVKIKAETENAPGLTATTYTTAKDIDINEECILDDLVQSENVFDADGKRSGYGEENLGKSLLTTMRYLRIQKCNNERGRW